MTSPFIMSLGIGVAAIRADKKAESDSFGLLALCSVGPILSVLILGFFYGGAESPSASSMIHGYDTTTRLAYGYVSHLPEYLKEVAVALAPVLGFFAVFQLIALRLHKVSIMRIVIGLLFTYGGLVLFLTGVNVGFSNLGVILGGNLASGSFKFVLIPIGALLGWFIVEAEPAVHILTKQVEEISAGAVSAKAMKLSLSVAISGAVALSMVRVLFSVNIMFFLVPMYIVALVLMFIVPSIFTAIAFDAGGVASGPMTATFLLPLLMGACEAVGGNILTDAFGVVALVAGLPLITVQFMGLFVMLRQRKEEPEESVTFADAEVIELWEV